MDMDIKGVGQKVFVALWPFCWSTKRLWSQSCTSKSDGAECTRCTDITTSEPQLVNNDCSLLSYGWQKPKTLFSSACAGSNINLWCSTLLMLFSNFSHLAGTPCTSRGVPAHQRHLHSRCQYLRRLLIPRSQRRFEWLPLWSVTHLSEFAANPK